MRIANANMGWVLKACESDAVVTGQFFKVNGLVDPPSRLLHPAFVYRIATVNLCRDRGVQQSAREATDEFRGMAVDRHAPISSISGG